MDVDATESRGPQTLILSVVFTAIAGVILILRIITRACIVRNIGPEDWLIVLAYIFSVVLTVLIGVEVLHGEGRHADTITPPELKKLLLAFWLSLPFYQASLVLTKASILLQFHRVFVGEGIRRAIWILMAICGIYGVWSVLGNLFLCLPVSAFWDLGIKGRCMNDQAVWFANAALNIITDIAIFLLPMPALKQLQLPRRQKLGLMGVFALGGFVCLVSILRLRALYVISVSKDVTWDNGPAAYWSSVEVNVGVICASLPTLKAFISRFFPKILGNSSRNGGTSTRGRNFDSRYGVHGTVSGNITNRHNSMYAKGGVNTTAIEMKSKTESMDAAMLDLGNTEIRVVTVVEQEARAMSEIDDIESVHSAHGSEDSTERITHPTYLPG